MKICKNNARGLIFATRGDREKREKYHCGGEDNAYNNREAGVINRRTPYVIGIPDNDMGLFNEMAMFGELTQQ